MAVGPDSAANGFEFVHKPAFAVATFDGLRTTHYSDRTTLDGMVGRGFWWTVGQTGIYDATRDYYLIGSYAMKNIHKMELYLSNEGESIGQSFFPVIMLLRFLQRSTGPV